MRRPVNQLAARSACALLWVLLAAGPTAAQAPESARGGGRWVPSLAITGGGTFQNQDSSVESMCMNGGFGDSTKLIGNCSGFPDGFPVAGSGPAPLRPIDGIANPTVESGSERAVSPYVGGNLELLTPEIPIPTRPRLFVQGELLPTFATDRNIAAEGDPSGVAVPTDEISGEILPPAGPGGFFQNQFVGVGSRTTSTVETLVYGASLGLAFPFELQGRRIRVKPSVGWLRYEMQVEGTVEAGIKDDFVLPDGTSERGPNVRDCTYIPNPTPPPNFLAAPCRGISLSASQSKWYNGIGPGLEIEMDAARWGPIGTSLYVDFHAYKILGDRDVDLSASTGDQYQFQQGRIPPDTYTARWSFSVNPWLYRAGVGIRFSWLGNASRR